ncbi:hypothetical protein [Nonomuraea sp. NPDC049684]
MRSAPRWAAGGLIGLRPAQPAGGVGPVWVLLSPPDAVCAPPPTLAEVRG